ncbi:hypothetical protein [Nocardia nova]|uniref:hypothetical protein n=1 Tax=Nocardia nova TaxID=37330 RepID=UPI0033F6093A
MRVFEKLCVAAVVVGGVSLGAGAAGAAVAPAPAGPSFVDDSLAGSSAGVPGFLSSGIPDVGSSAGSVGSLPALASFSANLGLCGATTASSVPLCVPG